MMEFNQMRIDQKRFYDAIRKTCAAYLYNRSLMILFPKYFREERQKRKEEKEEEKRRKDEDRKLAEVKRRRELEEAKEAAKEAAAAKMAAALGLNNNGLIGGPNGHGGLHGANGLGFANGLGSGADCVFDSMQVEFDVDDDLNMADVEDGNDMDEDDLDRIDEDEDDEEEEEDEEDDTTCFGKRFSFQLTMPLFFSSLSALRFILLLFKFKIFQARSNLSQTKYWGHF